MKRPNPLVQMCIVYGFRLHPCLALPDPSWWIDAYANPSADLGLLEMVSVLVFDNVLGIGDCESVGIAIGNGVGFGIDNTLVMVNVLVLLMIMVLVFESLVFASRSALVMVKVLVSINDLGIGI